MLNERCESAVQKARIAYIAITVTPKTELIDGQLRLMSLASKEIMLVTKSSDAGLFGTLSVEGKPVEGWVDVLLLEEK